MLAWWDSLSLISQIFACIAIPTTLVLAIQTVLMLIGLDGDGAGDIDGDLSLDHDGIFGEDVPMGDPDPSGLDGLRIFSVRGIIAFLVVFGWVGLVMDSAGAQLCKIISSKANNKCKPFLVIGNNFD